MQGNARESVKRIDTLKQSHEAPIFKLFMENK
jgi:hypothetical protein